MNKKIFVFVFGIAILAFSTYVRADPAEASLTFHFQKNGDFRANIALDSLPDSYCSLSLYAIVTNTKGDGKGRTTRSFLASKITTSRFNRFLAARLPKVSHVASGTGVNAFAILNLQVKVVCPKSTIISNAFARYLDCGKNGGTNVTPTGFLSILRGRLR